RDYIGANIDGPVGSSGVLLSLPARHVDCVRLRKRLTRADDNHYGAARWSREAAGRRATPHGYWATKGGRYEPFLEHAGIRGFLVGLSFGGAARDGMGAVRWKLWRGVRGA